VSAQPREKERARALDSSGEIQFSTWDVVKTIRRLITPWTARTIRREDGIRQREPTIESRNCDRDKCERRKPAKKRYRSARKARMKIIAIFASANRQFSGMVAVVGDQNTIRPKHRCAPRVYPLSVKHWLCDAAYKIKGPEVIEGIQCSR